MGPYHMCSNFKGGTLDMLEPIPHGFQFIDGWWKSTNQAAAVLHGCVDNIDWDMAANANRYLQYGTYATSDHGFVLQEARNIYSNVGSRVGFTDPM